MFRSPLSYAQTLRLILSVPFRKTSIKPRSIVENHKKATQHRYPAPAAAAVPVEAVEGVEEPFELTPLSEEVGDERQGPEAFGQEGPRRGRHGDAAGERLEPVGRGGSNPLAEEVEEKLHARVHVDDLRVT